MDLATLGLRFESQEAVTAEKRLDAVATAAGRADTGAGKASTSMLRLMEAMLKSAQATEQAIRDQNEFVRGLAEGAAAAAREAKAVDQLAASTTKMAAETQRASNVVDLAQRRVAKAHAQGAAGAKLQSYEMLNLGRQFADVGTMLASGQSPFLLIAQQGPQIADILGVAAARGVTFRMALTQIMAAAAPLLAALAPIALIAGSIGGAFAIAAQQINAENKGLIGSLGLTEEQLKKVENKTVTMGDVMKGTWKTASDALMEAFGPQLKAVETGFSQMWERLVDNTVEEMRNIVGWTTGAIAAIGATWKMLPAAMGDAILSGANLVIKAVTDLANKAIGVLNGLIGFANRAAEAAGLSFRLPTMEEIKVAEFRNQYAGAMADAGKVGMEAFAKGNADGRAGLDGALATLEKNILGVARARMIEEAGEAKAIKSKGDEAKAAQWLAQTLRELAAARKAGEAAAVAFNKEIAGRPDIDPVAEMARQAEKQWTADLLEMKRRGLDLAQTETERLRYTRDISAILAERLGQEQRGYTAAEIAQQDMGAAFTDYSGALGDAADAIERHDWGRAITSLFNSFKALEWANLSTAGKIGAVAGAGQMIGQAVGGTAGSAISGAASGMMAGATIGSILPGIGTVIGAGVGAIIGGLAGIFGGAKQEAENRARAAEQEAQRLAAIANQRRQLEIAIMQATGDTVGALAAQRADELAAMDASLRPMAERLYALADEAEAAAKAAAAAEELAQKTADLARQQRTLEIQLAQAQGRALDALNMSRRDELAAMDESLRALQQFIWYANDLATATAALAAANDNLASAAANLAGLQEQAANRAAQAVVDQLRQVSDAAEEQLRVVSQAQAEASQRVEAARAALSAAYEREAGALRDTLTRFQGFADSLRAFRESLSGEGVAGSLSYGLARATFGRTAGLAAGGDATAMGGLQSVSEGFLNASKSNARTLLDYQRDVAAVRAALKTAEAAAGTQVDTAQAQLDALNESVNGLLKVNESVLSVRDAIFGLAGAQASQAQAQLAVDSAQAAAMSALAQAQAAAAAWSGQQAQQQSQAQAAALAAAQAAVSVAQQKQTEAAAEVTRVENTKPPGYTDWTSYLSHYSDVANAYATDPNGRISGRTPEEWARLHYEVSGQFEGRTPYALGGVFTNGVVTEPTSFHNSMMGEAGPEAIMPLDRGPDGRLGVRAMGANDDSAAEEVRALRSEVASLKAKEGADNARIIALLAKIENVLTTVTEGGRAMQTEVAA